jgi:23S rRNA (uracil1939-C5)-methyltransferase
VVQFLKKTMHKFEILPYDDRTGEGQLRYLDFRYSFWRKEIVLTLVTKHAAFPQGQRLARALLTRFPFIAGVLQNVNEETGNVIWGKEFRNLAGRDAVIERIGPHQLKYPAGVFSQVNPATAQKLYERVCKMAALNGRENVLDLYCGVGPISLYLAAAARAVRGIDESLIATATAKQNAMLNGFGNCRFLAGNVAEKIAPAKTGLDRIDVVVVNPPRKGIQPDALGPLLSLAAPTLLYVSCNPVTLARDLVRLGREGYQTKLIEAFDMFPQTTEVETVALLTQPTPGQPS